MSDVNHKPGCSASGETVEKHHYGDTGELAIVTTCRACGRRHIERIDWHLTVAARKASEREDALASKSPLGQPRHRSVHERLRNW